MANDVIQKCIAGNDVKNGYVVMGVDKAGNKHTIAPPARSQPIPEAIEARLTDRFDDVSYYNN